MSSEGRLRAWLANRPSEQNFGWWLLRPHSAEAWFRFDFGYCLDRVYNGEYQVLAEVARVDLVVVPPQWHLEGSPGMVDEDKIKGKIELKVNGNWYTKNDGLCIDVVKVDGYNNVPSVALCIWALVTPSPRAGEDKYSVISRQIRDKVGTSDGAEIDTLMSECNAEMLSEQSVNFFSDDFSDLRMRLYAYRNEAARTIR